MIRTATKILTGVELVYAIRKETRRSGNLFGFSVITELQQLIAA
jgi:putative transposase